MFLVSIAAFIYVSALCWLVELRRAVLVSWAVWLVVMVIKQPFGLPYYTLTITQALTAIVLLLRWRSA